MTQDFYYVLAGVGALLGGLAALRTKGIPAERKAWERIYSAMAAENKQLREECLRLRVALLRALNEVRKLSNR